MLGTGLRPMSAKVSAVLFGVPTWPRLHDQQARREGRKGGVFPGPATFGGLAVAQK